MKVELHYHNATREHCEVDVIMDGVNTGTLHVQQRVAGSFHQIVAEGCKVFITDSFASRGESLPAEGDVDD